MSLPQYLDGPKFVAWLSSEGIHRQQLTDAQKRRYYEWEKGARADYYSTCVDELLTTHLLQNLIPDDIWATDQRRKGGRRSTTDSASRRSRPQAAAA